MTKKRQSLIAICLLIALIVGMFGSSMAYFSDYIATETNGTAGTVQISVDDNINLLNPDGQDILNPGDIRNVNFEIQNEGNKSVDTEVVITLTSSVPMSDNKNLGGMDKSISPFIDIGGGDDTEADRTLYGYDPYSSEYELYWADDVIHVEGYGNYPKKDVLPVQARYINGIGTQIVYVLDGAVLSGNSSLDEREVEYVGASDKLYVLDEETDIFYAHGDLAPIGVYDTFFAEAALDLYETYDTNAIVIGNEMLGEDGNMHDIEYLIIYHSLNGGFGVPDYITDVYVGDGVKKLVIVDDDGTSVCSIEEFEEYFDVTVHTYGDLEKLINASGIITEFEYNQLSDEEKENFVKAEDKQTCDFVLLFDPHASNAFQNSSVSIKIEVRAKQHRNTEAGWELVFKSVDASIDDTLFEVEYDELHRVELVNAKQDIYSMTEITIPEGVEVIPANFFNNLPNLQKVTLPSTIVEIQDKAFFGCNNLTTINLPEGLEYIGKEAFAETGALDITIPDSVVVIDTEAFYNSGLTTLDLGNGVKKINNSAFNGCDDLESVVIPASVEYMGDEVFEFCGLKSAVVNNKYIGYSQFYECSALENVELNGVEKIDDFAFAFTALKTVIVPDTVTQLGTYAFNNCESLETVYLSNNITAIGDMTFTDCDNLTTVCMNGGTANVISGNIRKIGSSAFRNCTSLTNIEISGKVETIGYMAFNGCTNLATVVIGNSVKTIDSLSFQNCKNLTKITIGNGVNNIDKSAFMIASGKLNTTVHTDNDYVMSYDWAWNNRNVTFE